jgi:pantothenate kinase
VRAQKGHEKTLKKLLPHIMVVIGLSMAILHKMVSNCVHRVPSNNVGGDILRILCAICVLVSTRLPRGAIFIDLGLISGSLL